MSDETQPRLTTRWNRQFPTTHWSEVYSVREADQEKGRQALNRLLERYRPALLAHLRFKFRTSREEPEDLLQSFLAEKVVERDLVSQASHERGRFRTFLLSSLDRFVVSRQRKERARKRTPDAGFVALDELSDHEQPDYQDRSGDPAGVVWAQAVVTGALEGMQAECSRDGRDDLWGLFENRIVLPLLHDEEPGDYDGLIRRFGFKSPAQAFNSLNTAKRIFKRHLEGAVAEYAQDDAEAAEELQSLKTMLERAHRQSPAPERNFARSASGLSEPASAASALPRKKQHPGKIRRPTA